MMRCPVRATGTTNEGKISSCSAARTISGSMPLDANNRSTTRAVRDGGTSRAVASRPVLICSTVAVTRYAVQSAARSNSRRLRRLSQRSRRRHRAETRLGACRHRKSSDERVADAELRQLGTYVSQRARERRFLGHATTRPGLSPCLAPGRSTRHRSTSASIAATDHVGGSRTSRCRSICSASV